VSKTDSLPMVLLRMVDSWSDIQKLTREGMGSLKPYPFYACGFLVAEDEDSYKLAGLYWETPGRLFDAPFVAPKEMVKEIVYLEERCEYL